MSRYLDLLNNIRLMNHLTEADVSNAVMDKLFDETIKTYSEFRGIETVREITLTPDEKTYSLQTGEDYIVDAYWNKSHPSNILGLTQEQLDEFVVGEDYNYPSLPIIRATKSRMLESGYDKDIQKWFETQTNSTRKIQLDPVPTTNILLVSRKYYGKINFPQKDVNLIKKLLKAMMLEYIMGCGQISSQGDVDFDVKGMKTTIKQLRNDFFRTVQQATGRHS